LHGALLADLEPLFLAGPRVPDHANARRIEVLNQSIASLNHSSQPRVKLFDHAVTGGPHDEVPSFTVSPFQASLSTSQLLPEEFELELSEPLGFTAFGCDR
jgi:hypothetical protein